MISRLSIVLVFTLTPQGQVSVLLCIQEFNHQGIEVRLKTPSWDLTREETSVVKFIFSVSIVIQCFKKNSFRNKKIQNTDVREITNKSHKIGHFEEIENLLPNINVLI